MKVLKLSDKNQTTNHCIWTALVTPKNQYFPNDYAIENSFDNYNVLLNQCVNGDETNRKTQVKQQVTPQIL
jgi:hypothetical protein